MGKPRFIRVFRFPLIVAALICILMLLSSTTSGQIGLFTPTPKPPPPTAEPTLTPPPTPSPTTKPVPSSKVPLPDESPLPGDDTDESPGPDETITPPPLDEDGKKVDDGKLPAGLEEPFPLVIPQFPRTRSRNTVALVRALQPLTKLGIPQEQVLIDGMGRFPVAGLAYYSDDWLNPRFTPVPHLHHGLDIFADFGTPIRAPDRGVITRLTNGPTGGIGVWMRGADGIHYYFAHLLERAERIHIGMRTQIGTVLGYVGDTGNASGGTPHLHFEIHPGGGAPVPPKPSVDGWLDEAENIAPKWVQAKQEEYRTQRTSVGPASSPGARADELEPSMLLTVLDPVGGSVGMLPKLDVHPRRSGLVSEKLLQQLIGMRVQGRVLFPSSAVHLYD